LSTVTIHDGDADGDGIPDDWETAHGLNPHLASDAALDSDGDGFTNLQEFIMGTDPQDPKSRFQYSVTQNGNDMQITFPTVPGRTYTVQYCGDLTQPWITLQGGLAGTGNPVTVTDSNAVSMGQRFYHVKVQMP
jgi:hypothetical protein